MRWFVLAEPRVDLSQFAPHGKNEFYSWTLIAKFLVYPGCCVKSVQKPWAGSNFANRRMNEWWGYDEHHRLNESCIGYLNRIQWICHLNVSLFLGDVSLFVRKTTRLHGTMHRTVTPILTADQPIDHHATYTTILFVAIGCKLLCLSLLLVAIGGADDYYPVPWTTE